MDGFLPGGNIEMSSECFMPDYPGRPPFIVDGPYEMTKAVRAVIRAGADWIKLCATGGAFEGMDKALCPQFTREEIGVAVSEAHRVGKPVMVHAVGGEAITDAIIAGARSIEHGIFLSEAQAAAMKEAGTYFVPTLTVYWDIVELAKLPNSPLPRAVADCALGLEARLGEAVRIADALGVPIALGSDFASRDDHGRNLEEIARLHRAGLSVEKSLLAATSTGASLLGLEGRVGRIEPGHRFDAILLDEDPSDPEIFMRPGMVSGVFKSGRPALAHPRLRPMDKLNRLA
jgi:imidazolonepropionase-like amidohydrolase